ncbi:MAG: hypothetical protein JW809_16110 [Pirellulales bacterium]|nr:hypothetical protein [Pirellulales bacterium]
MSNVPSPRRLRFSLGEIGAVAFTAVYMAVWLAVSFLLKNDEFVFYFVVMCLLIVAVGAVHLRVRLHVGALWGLSIWGLAHMAGGLMPVPAAWPIKGDAHVLYNWWIVPGALKYDQLIHAYGFGLVTWICWQSLRAVLARRAGDGLGRVGDRPGIRVDENGAVPLDASSRDVPKPTLGLMTLCVAAGMGFGAANEVVEFIATLALPGTNVGGYENTGWDLVANLVGCVAAATIIAIRHSSAPASGGSGRRP